MTPEEMEIYGYKSLKPDFFKKAREIEKNLEVASAEQLGKFIHIKVVRPISNLKKYQEVMNKQVLQFLCA